MAEIERGLESLGRAREQVRQAYADIDPDMAEIPRVNWVDKEQAISQLQNVKACKIIIEGQYLIISAM